MKQINYKTSGTCARLIHVTIDDEDIVRDIVFEGGCDGNHKGLVSLCIGMKADEVVKRLRGLTCGPRDTSCPDQLARAIEGR